jgi:hypothetical protein
VRVQRAFYGSLADRPQCIHLKGGAGRAYKTLYQQRAIFANQESSVAYRLKSFRGIGDCRVQPFTDLSHRREALIDNRFETPASR